MKIALGLHAALTAAVDNVPKITKQNRSEAIRRLVELGLKVKK
jgi:metal-responsive CopG/Arc/MetJ family transcriptional regulator